MTFSNDMWYRPGDEGRDSNGDDDDFFPPDGHPKVMQLESLRDHALLLFSKIIDEKNDFKTIINQATAIEKHGLLSMADTEQIVRSFAAKDNGSMMAVGGQSPREAEEQVRKMLAALIERIHSNLVAAAVKRDLLDVAFDSEKNDFIFSVNENGKKFAEEAETQLKKRGPNNDSGIRP